MHTLVIRRELYRQHPWIAVSLMKAFSKAKDIVMRDLYELAALTTLLPWQVVHVEETRRMLGEDWWPYGIELNRHVLQNISKIPLRARAIYASPHA